MSLQILDFILIGTMLISGILALSRGFTREALSLLAWGGAAGAAVGAAMTPQFVQFASTWLQPQTVAQVGVGAVAFLIVLILLSLVGVRIADWVLDSAAGPVDRTLGFAYGLGRGLLLVTVAYCFYIWLVPANKRENWIQRAASLGIIEQTAGALISFLPSDIDQMLRSKMAAAAAKAGAGAQPTPEEGYQAGQTRGLNQLIQGTGATPSGQPAPVPQQPVFGSPQTGEGQ
jgi:membrane protein required for colicin V production